MMRSNNKVASFHFNRKEISMAFYSKEEIRKAKEIDLYTYLKNRNPDELVYFSRDTYTTKEHDSLKISNGMWYWFSKGIGGKSALDYLIQVKNYSFTDAMAEVLGYSNGPIKYNYTEKKKENIELQLPEKNENNNKVISYLKSRGIDEDIIKECIDKELIYESKENHNVVFVGYDMNYNPKFGCVRGTNKTRYMHDCYGSNKAFSFKLKSFNDKKDSIHLFESAIDLLSYATLLKLENKNYHEENLLSLAGVYQPAKVTEDSKLPIALNLFLYNNKNINKIYLHLDNDEAGRLATIGLKNSINNKYEIIDEPPKYGKDFNDYLCHIKEIKTLNYERGKEHEL